MTTFFRLRNVGGLRILISSADHHAVCTCALCCAVSLSSCVAYEPLRKKSVDFAGQAAKCDSLHASLFLSVGSEP